ncbi:MAG: ComEC/Rec2 family competence protein [Peptostreptococcaceae bacterium]|nr:ComEC/Rec2 family competence protein [Peptostreptococcaceae bacterium]
MKKGLLLLVIILILSGASFAGFRKRNRLPQELEVHFIDIGQGDSMLVRTVGGKNMLIDAGSGKESDKLIDYLKVEGIKKLDVVIATHPDEDHIGGMARVIKDFEIGSFYMPNRVHNTASFEQMLLNLKDKKVEVLPAHAGEKIPFDPDVELLVLNPDKREYINNNSYSIVTKLTYQNNSFLFTGDIDAVNEYNLLSDYYEQLDSDVLKIAHHGSSSSSSPDFIKAVSPAAGVISCGRDNNYGHPHAEVLKRLKGFGIPIYRTDEQGSIVFYSDGQNIEVNSSTTGSYE